MADESLATTRSRRAKPDKSGRAAALEKFKAVKSGQKKAYEIVETDEDVYEEVTEEEYNRRVNERRSDFIVGPNDEYQDDGYEMFDEEFDEAEKKKKEKTKVSYKAPKSAHEKRQDAVQSGNIRSMFLTAPTKRKAEKASLENDELLENLMKSKGMAGIDGDDENIAWKSSEKRIKKQPASNPFAAKNTVVAAKKTPVRAKSPVKPKDIEMEPINEIKEEKVSQATEFDDDEDIKEEPVVLAAVEDDEQDDISDAAVAETKHKIDEVDLKAAIIKEEKENKIDAFLEEDDFATEEKPTTMAAIPATLPLIKNENGQEVMNFFWLDAYEEPYRQVGIVYLFGKVVFGDSTISCSIVVKNIPRKLFFLPKTQIDNDGQDSTASFEDVHREVTDILKQHGITNFRCKPSEKKYVYPSADIPQEATYLEVQYYPSNAARSLGSDLKGRTFSRVFGTHTSSLETFLLEKRMKGPSWLDISDPKLNKVKATTCKFEVDCDMKDLSVSEMQPDPPNVTILTLQAKVVRNDKSQKDEIVMLTGLVNESYPFAKAPPQKLFSQHFLLISPSGDRSLPHDFKREIASEKIKITPCDNERILISQMNAKMTKIDPDIVVGHDINGYTIPALMNTMERYKIVKPSALSRMNRSNIQYVNMAKLDRSHLLPGRVVCDIKMSARELIQAKSYELVDLVNDILETSYDEVSAHVVKEMFTRSASLRQLCKQLMAETQFVMKLLAELNVLPLATQITNICGNTLTQTLQKGRALRNEFLLLHAFNDKNYIVPDKETRSNRKQVESKKESSKDDVDKSKKASSYSGGLVLDPIVGFYDSMILLMDFNSLYPSIIQEYNVCFTTCKLLPPETSKDAPETDWEAQIPHSTVETGVLPSEIKKLVDSRRTVKALIKTPNLSKDKLQQYDIRQKALKLTANSMYGCLGFQGSRFYAKPLAALITQRGRDILMNAKSMAESMGYSIIYGDTDSIMINTGTRRIQEVNEIGNKIRMAINKQYKQLEIEIDGVFRSMLLLKKKKYAACSLIFGPDGSVKGEKNELKGLDIVRRDWSEIARKTGRFVVEALLKGDVQADDAVDTIHRHLQEVSEKINENKLPFEDYIITKQLTKNVENYPDSKNQPHVLVAMRCNSRGARKLRAGDTVQYVICEDGTENPHTQRAYSKDEIQSKMVDVSIDKAYYITQQIFPVVSRLIEPIQGTDAAIVAEKLGLDPTKYNRRTTFNPSEAIDSELSIGISLLLPETLDSDIFQNAEPFSVDCPKCATPISLDGPIFKKTEGKVSFLMSKCGSCHSQLGKFIEQMCNQLTRKLQLIQKNAESLSYVCQICDFRHPDVLFNVHDDDLPRCTSCGEDSLQLESQFFQSYAQLRYWRFMFDLDYYMRVFPEEKDIFEADAVKIICGAFIELIDKFLKENGFVSFSLKAYMAKLKTSSFRRRPRVDPDADIP